MDYCTWFPEGWWSHCCLAHDIAYAAGVERWTADRGLLTCVAGADTGIGLLSGAIALLMFLGVRLFGARYFKAKE